MSHRNGLIAGILVMLALPHSSALAQVAEKAAEQKPVAIMATSLAFNDINVPGFDPGMQIAVLAGDPGKAEPYTLRLKFPAGYAFPPHWHPVIEHLTVVSGDFYLGMGETVDKAAAHAYKPGDFLIAPARMPHFGWVKGETVIQLHGVGPFEIKLVGEK
ncbi:MAG: cupin domain-containing protein [Gemmatimonadota bacterium]